MFAVCSVGSFGRNDPWHFGHLPIAFLTLFRMTTLEDWTDIMYINMYGSDNYGYDGINVARTSSPSPLGAAIFFSSFVFIGTMVVLNLVIGVIMNSMDEMRKELQAELESRSRDESDAERELQEINQQLEAIKKNLASLSQRIN